MGVLDDEARWCREQLAIMKRNKTLKHEGLFDSRHDKEYMQKVEYERLLHTAERMRDEAQRKYDDAKKLQTQAEVLIDAYDKFNKELEKMKPEDA
jgi:hypothetical protein